MPWASHAVQQSFQTLINALVDFHDQCGKQKNQEQFGNIRLLCEGALDFLFKEEMPNGADQIVSTISTGIQVALKGIGNKKSGGAENDEFISKLLEASNRAVLFKNACEREIEKKEKGKDKRKLGEKVGQVVTAMEGEVLVPIEQTHRALTILDDQQTLTRKIESLGEVPKKDFSCFTFFKSMAGHYPKTTASGVLTTSIALGYSGLTTLSHYVGPAINTLLHADESSMVHQAVLAGALLLTGVTLLTVAAGKTCTSQAEEDRVEVVNEKTRLLRV